MRLSFTQLLLLFVLFLFFFYKNTIFFNKLNVVISSFIRFFKKYHSNKKIN